VRMEINAINRVLWAQVYRDRAMEQRERTAVG
jgi:hypothetical protein